MRKISSNYENPIDNFLYIIIENISDTVHKYNISPNMITTFSNINALIGIYYLYKRNFILGAIFYFIAYFFDCLDGYIAIKYNLVTKFGDYYDHISDFIKLFLYFYVLYIINPTLFIQLIPLYIILILFLLLHLHYQELLYSKKNESDTLFWINYIIPTCLKPKNKEQLKINLSYTRFFGCGTLNLIIPLTILFFATINPKKYKKI